MNRIGKRRRKHGAQPLGHNEVFGPLNGQYRILIRMLFYISHVRPNIRLAKQSLGGYLAKMEGPQTTRRPKVFEVKGDQGALRNAVGDGILAHYRWVYWGWG
jgi:hypothetical protein